MHGFGGYTRIPDKDRGDSGLEAYSHDGNAYQCFADQGSNSTKERYEKQRKKIHDDLQKFKDVQRIKRLLDDQKISRWILVVPRMESKELIKYCRDKTSEIKKLGLPYVTKGFRVEVRDEADLSGYISQMNIIRINLREPSVDRAETEAAIGHQLAELDEKLGRVYVNVESRSAYRSKLILDYAKSENYLKDLAEIYPDTLNLVQSAITARESHLLSIGPADRSSPRQVLDAELNELHTALAIGAPKLPAHVRMTIVLGTIARWLFRCPLRFDHVTP